MSSLFLNSEYISINITAILYGASLVNVGAVARLSGFQASSSLYMV